MNKNPFNLDERNVQIILRICAVLYAIPLLLLMAVQFRRQFILGQTTEEYADIANILVFNVVLLLGGILYLGGFTPEKVKIRHLLAVYVVFILAGLGFTVFKYAVLLGQPVGLAQVGDYLLIVSVICAALVALWSLLGYLGKRRIDRQIE